MSLKFTKFQAAGNDYIVIDGRKIVRDWSELALNMCRHHFGVCSDGILVLENSDNPNADVKMRVFNPDGSEAEMSGNGIRIFTKFTVDNRIAGTTGGVLRVEAGGIVYTVLPYVREGLVTGARVPMGKPDFSHEGIGLSRVVSDTKRIVINANGLTLKLTCLSIGNPHAVFITDERVEDFPLSDVGPYVENHLLFKNRINFEVVNVIDMNTIRARIFERGAGETLSSGTGSTASALAALEHKKCKSPVKVILDGGELEVDMDEAGTVYLEGTVEAIFEGIWQN